MSLITIKRDSTIVLPNIRVQLNETSPDETGDPNDNRNSTGEMQTKVDGIMQPLIALNGIYVPYGDLLDFQLDWTRHVPEIEFAFYDREQTFSQFSTPGISNELQLQIIPSFDNAYKKVNLLFYVTEIIIENGTVRGHALYKVLDLIQGRFKCLGEKSTYELCDKISEETGLGFASNVELTDDKRFIYAPMKSYLDILDSEIENSASGEEHVYDYWIDLWNNLILCDMYDRYNSDDDEEDMKVWVSNILNNPMYEVNVEPLKVVAIFSNTPYSHNTELWMKGYTFNNAPSGYSLGTSKVVSLYSEETHDYVDNYIMDGDVEDEFLVNEYGGEFYGSYNYLVAKQCRDIYLRKVYGETISIYTAFPMLGIVRGDQVRVVWYDCDTNLMNKMEGFENTGITPLENMDLGWMNQFVFPKDNDRGIMLNINVSGQYTVVGSFITFRNNSWTQEFVLARPASKKTPLIPEIQYTSND